MMVCMPRCASLERVFVREDVLEAQAVLNVAACEEEAGGGEEGRKQSYPLWMGALSWQWADHVLAMLLAVARSKTRDKTAGAMVVVVLRWKWPPGNPDLLTRKFGEALGDVVNCACN